MLVSKEFKINDAVIYVCGTHMSGPWRVLSITESMVVLDAEYGTRPRLKKRCETAGHFEKSRFGLYWKFIGQDETTKEESK